MGEVISMVARRHPPQAAKEPFAVYHREGKVYVRCDGHEVMVNMTPDQARAWARALDENADAVMRPEDLGAPTRASPQAPAPWSSTPAPPA